MHRVKRRLNAAEVKFVRSTVGYSILDHRENEDTKLKVRGLALVCRCYAEGGSDC